MEAKRGEIVAAGNEGSTRSAKAQKGPGALPTAIGRWRGMLRWRGLATRAAAALAGGRQTLASNSPWLAFVRPMATAADPELIRNFAIM